MPRTLLIVDDDPAIRKVLDSAFTDAGYLALSAQNGEEGLELVRRHAPDLLVLDVVMPRVDGLEVCRRVRADPATAALPILFLTSQSDEIDRVVGLELGADDYVAKPFALREVLARVKALLRRAGAGDAAARVSEVIRVAGLRIDCAKWTVTLPNDLPVKLTKSEFTLLRVLAERPGRVRTREELVARYRPDGANVLDRTVDAHLASLRRKLGDAGDRIETVHGVGYRLRE